VPARHAFEYAVIRVVPEVGREEFVNAGVVLFARSAGFLGCEIALDRDRVRALVGGHRARDRGPGVDPDLDLDLVAAHLQAMHDVCAGAADAGPIARMSPSERFHWLVAPRSAAIQISPVHGGVTDDPAAMLSRLYQTLVAR
jgi:hypothetical protein